MRHASAETRAEQDIRVKVGAAGGARATVGELSRFADVPAGGV